MKYIQRFLFIICLVISFKVQAQQNHFIYIQADAKQPFYVKLDKKIYSSSASGYLILSKLKAGGYDLVIGFPQNEWPEQSIQCKVDDNDQGYLLKNFGDKGWGFFDLQSLNVWMASNTKAVKKADTLTEVKTDAFSNMLSEVVNDPTIRQREPVKEEVKKILPDQPKVAPVAIAEPVKDKITEVVKPAPLEGNNVEISPIEKPVESKNIIIKKLSSRTSLGSEGIYLDIADGRTDTISVFIAEDKIVPDSSFAKTIAETKPVEPEKKDLLKTEFKKEVVPLMEEKKELKKEAVTSVEEKDKENKFIEVTIPDRGRPAKERKPDSVVQQNTSNKVAIINSDCKEFASDEDFLKLRKKMAAAHNEEMMIISAKKAFKSKCFTTEQVKNLSTLFLKDEHRYSFFDAAYPFVSDSQNFTTLESQLTDGYYINRFKVMIRH
ncbi:DUF4476 domain-containing protein [Ferruginibacter paludis]|uniref:DUF4476 domain-containing protein n=1 Tax=Ferruginibacter paludis TaxID=1310417 RepID=UPI0025B36B2C|nr:DUF4476 domain-containing protein [Ferruginibacter paludis]MDN3658784.1 DUF4476 domain-containing protein [Ferruginibacter paludis]